MKKIGIDARLYSQTGVGVYIRNFLHYLERKIPEDIIFNVYIMEDDLQKYKPVSDRIKVKKANFHWHSISEQTGFLNQLNKDNNDLMHFTYFSYPLLYKKKFIATIHDLTPLLFKTGRASTKSSLIYNMKYQMLKKVLQQQVRSSAAIITPSNTVKNDIVKYYGELYANKIYAIYEGVDYQLTEIKPNEELVNKYNYDYFLYVGNFYPHKNVQKLISAFAKVRGNTKLLLVGPEDFFTEEIKEHIAKEKVSDKVVVINNRSREDLVYFYQHAKGLISPSLAEGFGLPLLEAAYFNLPIIASNIAVFKELWGDDYLSFDPQSQEDIAAKINQYLQTSPTFNYSERLTTYSFERMTEEIFALYQSIL